MRVKEWKKKAHRSDLARRSCKRPPVPFINHYSGIQPREYLPSAAVYASDIHTRCRCIYTEFSLYTSKMIFFERENLWDNNVLFETPAAEISTLFDCYRFLQCPEDVPAAARKCKKVFMVESARARRVPCCCQFLSLYTRSNSSG